MMDYSDSSAAKPSTFDPACVAVKRQTTVLFLNTEMPQ